MTDASDRLTPATPEDLADALAFALRFDRGKRKHDGRRLDGADRGEALVEDIVGAGLVVMKKPPSVGAGAVGSGYEKP